MSKKLTATTQYRTMHRLVFFSEYDRDLKTCSGEQVPVPSGSLATVIDGRREHPVCQTEVLGKTVYGYIWPDHHEAIVEQADTHQIFAQQDGKGGHD
jgi:hypothetical protein